MRPKHIVPCGATHLPEYWSVLWREKGKHIDIIYHAEPNRSEGYYYCTNDFCTPSGVDLCRSCMVRYGLLW